MTRAVGYSATDRGPGVVVTAGGRRAMSVTSVGGAVRAGPWLRPEEAGVCRVRTVLLEVIPSGKHWLMLRPLRPRWCEWTLRVGVAQRGMKWDGDIDWYCRGSA